MAGTFWALAHGARGDYVRLRRYSLAYLLSHVCTYDVHNTFALFAHES